jgi:hypothetical protein
MLELLPKADPPMVALLLTSVLALIVAIAFGPTDYLGDVAKLQAPTVLSDCLCIGPSRCRESLGRSCSPASTSSLSHLFERRWQCAEEGGAIVKCDRVREQTSARIAKLWLPAQGCHWKSDCHGQAPIIRSSFALDLLDDHRIYEISAI